MLHVVHDGEGPNWNSNMLHVGQDILRVFCIGCMLHLGHGVLKAIVLRAYCTPVLGEFHTRTPQNHACAIPRLVLHLGLCLGHCASHEFCI